MSKTLTVEGDLATVDSRAVLTTQGSVSAPSLVVPAGTTRITRIFAAISGANNADGSAVFMIRLNGAAVQDGEQTLIISAGGRIAVQAGSDAAPAICPLVVLDDLDIVINPSEVITIAGEMMGSDIGTGRTVVTLHFG